MLLKPKKTINLPIYLSSLMCYSQVRTVFFIISVTFYVNLKHRWYGTSLVKTREFSCIFPSTSPHMFLHKW